MHTYRRGNEKNHEKNRIVNDEIGVWWGANARMWHTQPIGKKCEIRRKRPVTAGQAVLEAPDLDGSERYGSTTQAHKQIWTRLVPVGPSSDHLLPTHGIDAPKARL